MKNNEYVNSMAEEIVDLAEDIVNEYNNYNGMISEDSVNTILNDHADEIFSTVTGIQENGYFWSEKDALRMINDNKEYAIKALEKSGYNAKYAINEDACQADMIIRIFYFKDALEKARHQLNAEQSIIYLDTGLVWLEEIYTLESEMEIDDLIDFCFENNKGFFKTPCDQDDKQFMLDCSDSYYYCYDLEMFFSIENLAINGPCEIFS